MDVKESKIAQLIEELEQERADKRAQLDATKKKIGQLEEQKELLEQDKENNERIIMEKNALLGMKDGSIPKEGGIGDKNRTVRFEDTGVSQERNTVEMDWDYESKTMAENWEKGNSRLINETQPKRSASTPMDGACTVPKSCAAVDYTLTGVEPHGPTRSV